MCINIDFLERDGEAGDLRYHCAHYDAIAMGQNECSYNPVTLNISAFLFTIPAVLFSSDHTIW